MQRGEVEEGATITQYEDVTGCCRSMPLAEIAEHGHVLTPGRYVGAEEVDEAFEEKMQRLTGQLGEPLTKGAELERAQKMLPKILGLLEQFEHSP